MLQTLPITETLKAFILHGGDTDQGCQVVWPMCPSVKWKRIPWIDEDLILPVSYFLYTIHFQKVNTVCSFLPQERKETLCIALCSKIESSSHTFKSA